MKHTDQFIFCS